MRPGATRVNHLGSLPLTFLLQPINAVASRRRIVGAGAGLLLAAALPGKHVVAQDDTPLGRIAFVRNGDIWQWDADEGARKIVPDGSAQDPAWNPDGSLLTFVRDGGSFSDLVMANPKTGNTKSYSNNESDLEKGSPDYVQACIYVIDPCWPIDDLVFYVSDQDADPGIMNLWIVDPEGAEGNEYKAADDGTFPGSVEHISVDQNVKYCAYTLRPEGPFTTMVIVRDIDTGTCYPMMEAEGGAFDPAISPDGTWIVATRRDANGGADLWLANRESEELYQLTEGEEASAACWSPDGNWIAYIRMTDFQFEIRAMRVAPGADQPGTDSVVLVEKGSVDAPSGLSWAPE